MATITTIEATDNISDSRAVINTNLGNLNTDKIETSVLDTDGTLTANSDTKIATQKAVKTYADTKITNPMTTAGDIIYGGASGVPTRLAKGTSGQVLKMNVGETAPEWGTILGTGDVVAPATNTDSYIPQWDGANSKTLKNGLGLDTDLSSVSASDDTVPSAKATKAMGDLKLPLAGGTMTGDIQLGETDIKLDASLSADEKWSGIVVAGTAGATLAVGDVCYLASSGKWLLNDGILDGTDTGFSKQLGICVLAGGDTEATEMLVYGKIRSAAFPAFTVGSPVYLSDTAGDIQVAQPSTTNFAIRKVGYALSAEELMFNPSNDYIIHS